MRERTILSQKEGVSYKESNLRKIIGSQVGFEKVDKILSESDRVNVKIGLSYISLTSVSQHNRIVYNIILDLVNNITYVIKSKIPERRELTIITENGIGEYNLLRTEEVFPKSLFPYIVIDEKPSNITNKEIVEFINYLESRKIKLMDNNSTIFDDGVGISNDNIFFNIVLNTGIIPQRIIQFRRDYEGVSIFGEVNVDIIKKLLECDFKNKIGLEFIKSINNKIIIGSNGHFIVTDNNMIKNVINDCNKLMKEHFSIYEITKDKKEKYSFGFRTTKINDKELKIEYGDYFEGFLIGSIEDKTYLICYDREDNIEPFTKGLYKIKQVNDRVPEILKLIKGLVSFCTKDSIVIRENLKYDEFQQLIKKLNNITNVKVIETKDKIYKYVKVYDNGDVEVYI